MLIRLLLILALALVASAEAQAAVQDTVRYQPGDGGGVTFAAAPEHLTDSSGHGADLTRHGSPTFVAGGPPGRSSGAVRFNGTSDGYLLSHAVGTVPGNFVLEAWVCAAADNASGLHAAVADGDGALGYMIAQQDDRWVAFVGGVGSFDIAPVVAKTWIHLALVADGPQLDIYADGRRCGHFATTSGLRPTFGIGCSGPDKEGFSGDIAMVRLGTFPNGGFVPATDLLIDHAQVQAAEERDAGTRRATIATLLRPQPGVVIADTLTVTPAAGDWLVAGVSQAAHLIVHADPDGRSARMILENGLLSRTFYLGENLACIGYRLLQTDAQFLRAVKPEARIKCDGAWYQIGGLIGQPEKGYLLEPWLADMRSDPHALRFTGMDTGTPLARYPWAPKHNAVAMPWPPKGLRVTFHFAAPGTLPPQHRGLQVDVNYELYDGLPVLMKSLSVRNQGRSAVTIDSFDGEILAVTQDQEPRMHVESDYSFAMANQHRSGSALVGNSDPAAQKYLWGGGTTSWEVDPDYGTWATQNQAEDLFLHDPQHCLLRSRPMLGPDEVVPPGGSFTSFNTFELLQDSSDRERQSLGHRRLYRTLAPQVSEYLLCGAIMTHDTAQLKGFIDQLAAVGFERLSIQAGIDHDDVSAESLAHWKEIGDYARARHIAVGAYELWIASRGRGDRVDTVDPITGKPGSLMFGQSTCIASAWADEYLPRMWRFFDQTGFTCTEFDGPYHGDVCAATDHPHHRGLEDSQWQQWRTQCAILSEFQRRGYYVPLPDWYFLNGTSSTGMGYREGSANLTPQQQLLLGRQYIYDGTWHKIPPMGWIALQLVGYYSDDPRVGLEPLQDHLDRYEAGLFQLLGSGAQPMVIGRRLYDSDRTKAMVTTWVEWAKRYHAILTSDIIHVSRPTGRDLDCMLHVNPHLANRGMALVFNPTDRDMTAEPLRLPLYYAGITGTATVHVAGGNGQQFPVDEHGAITLPVTLRSGGFTWVLID